IGDYLDAAKWQDPCGGSYNSGVWMYNNLRGAANSGGQQASAPLASGPTTASNGWTRQYFDFAQNPTVYTASYLNRPTVVSYDDPVSIKAKAQWSKTAGLGGVMIWELSQDYNQELITATRAGWAIITVALAAISHAQTLCAPAYDATKTYLKGDSASVDGNNYVANWWSQNNDPAANSGPWSQWTKQGPCGTNKVIVVSKTPLPSSSTINVAKSSTISARPLPTSSATPSSDCFPSFDANKDYVQGEKASKDQNFVAHYWSHGTDPTANSANPWDAWTKQGSCGNGPIPTSAVKPSQSITVTSTSLAPPVASSTSSIASLTKSSTVSLSGTATSTATPVTTKSASAPATTQASGLPACYPNWTATPFGAGQIPYNNGDLVSYNSQNWVVGYQGAAGPPNAAAGSGWTLQGPCDGAFKHKPYTSPGLIGYWTQWSMYSRRQNAIDQLDLNGFTGINYAFVDALADGTLKSFDPNADLNYMRKFTAQRYKYPNLKAIISIGGWSG
ncbi:hypothetical protein HDU99_004507, partial [Rhizoclosmatium hyalinum]